MVEKKLTPENSEEEAENLPNSNTKTGLKTSEVEKRLKQYGFNEVPEKKSNLALAFAKKFWGLTAWMLEIIIVLSWFLQRYADLYIVAGLLMFNAILSFVEEQRASGVVEALKEKLHVNARVLRDDAWKIVPRQRASARRCCQNQVWRLRTC